MAELNVDDLGSVVRVLFDYKYKANDGRLISIEENEEFILIKKSNADWWQVIKTDVKKPIYVPAAYITQLQQKKYPDHTFFKKAHAALQKAKKKQKLLEGKKPDATLPHKERMIVVTGSREDLTVMSLKDSKYSEMRASCDSLDRFIENENPYDEVPFESTFSPRVDLNKSTSSSKKVEPLAPEAQYEEPEYENLENIIPSKAKENVPEPAPRRKSLENIVKSEGSTPSSPDNPRHSIDKAKHANLQGEDVIKPAIPQHNSPRTVTTVEVLDDGWELQLDNSTGNKYYYNTNSGEMRVKPPRKQRVTDDKMKTPQRGDRVHSPPAVPDVSKKPSFEPSRLSPEMVEDFPMLQRRKTSPARYKNTPRSPLVPRNQESQSPEPNDPWTVSPKNTPSVQRNNSNNSGYFSFMSRLSPDTSEKKKKHKKASSDAGRATSSPNFEKTKSRSSSFGSGELLRPEMQGWIKERSPEGEVVFVNEFNGDRWHEMTDEDSGKPYYFNEYTRQTVWELPQLHGEGETELEEPYEEEREKEQRKVGLSKAYSDRGRSMFKVKSLDREKIYLTQEERPKHFSLPHNTSPPADSNPSDPLGHLPDPQSHPADPPSVPSPSLKPRFARKVKRVMQARSMIILDDNRSFSPIDEFHQQETALKTSQSEYDLPEIGQGKSRLRDTDHSSVPPPHPVIERQGRLYWTKLVEAGKKQRKNWLQQWVVLLANNLLFYKDQKQAVMTKSTPHGRPDSSCDLRGAVVDWARDKSSKKNVLELKTVRGLSLLLQHEDITTIQKWLTAIKVTIQRANQVEPLEHEYLSHRNSRDRDEDDEDDHKKKKDKKKKSKAPSRHGSDAKNSDKVRSKLRKFINRRPTMESLQERGIIKETVFGCPLEKLCEKEQTHIPNFIKLCVAEVERRGLEVDGIYRVSGNLSHVQKLRYMIDRDEPVNLSEPEWEDIHLVTGALKMFLRELPEPVIPFAFFDKFVTACKMQDKPQRLKSTKALVQALPAVNRETLTYLMQHFRRVVERSSQNRMQIQNIAIVFGPTLLLKPPEESQSRPDSGGSSMAIYMAFQNQIIDYMLSGFESIFLK
ncbi:rho GTPase-activating protein 12 isoform X1 [Ciona intestinalis]